MVMVEAKSARNHPSHRNKVLAAQQQQQQQGQGRGGSGRTPEAEGMVVATFVQPGATAAHGPMSGKGIGALPPRGLGQVDVSATITALRTVGEAGVDAMAVAGVAKGKVDAEAGGGGAEVVISEESSKGVGMNSCHAGGGVGVQPLGPWGGGRGGEAPRAQGQETEGQGTARGWGVANMGAGRPGGAGGGGNGGGGGGGNVGGGGAHGGGRDRYADAISHALEDSLPGLMAPIPAMPRECGLGL